MDPPEEKKGGEEKKDHEEAKDEEQKDEDDFEGWENWLDVHNDGSLQNQRAGFTDFEEDPRILVEKDNLQTRKSIQCVGQVMMRFRAKDDPDAEITVR